MRLEVLPDPRAVARRAAEEVARVLRRKGRRRLVLASGKTMVAVYAELVRLHRRGRAPFQLAETFNLDELLLPPEDPQSFRAFMGRNLFSRVGLPAGNVHFLRGDAADLEAECRRYERQLARAAPDIALVGIGPNGHVAYLEPGSSLAPVSARVRLSPETRRDLAAQGIRPAPREALTMGIETILSAREIVLVATGRSKAAAVARALKGRVAPSCPASLLTLHPRLTVVLDRAAASSLWARPEAAPGALVLFRRKATGVAMPDKETLERAGEDKREGKAPSTQAEEFVREEMEHIREGKHGARSTKQAIAIGLSKARRAGVHLPAPKKGKASSETRRKASREVRRGRSRKKPSVTRARANRRALRREGHRAASKKSLSRQARTAAASRSKASRSRAAKKAAATRKRK